MDILNHKIKNERKYVVLLLAAPYKKIYMKNIALIIAGGVGTRMGQDIPKQFINVYDKPVIVYTLEAFQKHPQIDTIEVVCLDGWHDVLRAYAKQFGISKLEKSCLVDEMGKILFEMDCTTFQNGITTMMISF